MLTVKREGVLLEKSSLDFENKGVMNPAVIQDQKGIHLFYRAVNQFNYSTIGYCKLRSPIIVERRRKTPIILPNFQYESNGVEDPRIVKLKNTYYISYTAYDGINALGALATSKDLKTWVKRGIIVPKINYDLFTQLIKFKAIINEKYFRYNKFDYVHKRNYLWDKNVVFFPRRIHGKICFLHRIKPDIQIVEIKNIEDLAEKFWKYYIMNIREFIVISPKYAHEVCYVGGGCPPIETNFGWLVIYHGVYDTINGYVYTVCASLLDIDNPKKEIARLPYPLFKPELDWEREGNVNNVCFPSGSLIINGTLYIYYGAADERIATASIELSQLINELLLNTVNHENDSN
ncbi:glycoside hydrolase family 130 protein [Zhouia amylolytica]|uniref:Glycosidase-like protein n=1 Tax=Zhouia amylolytica AD3 TaxID=1286632 RepID=W2UU91_9FLAO|nr:pesticidal protein Cry7Aa [Zhouia amylolytica]ETN97096.1 glycosidase-like protein [Zhouia amylolytica AD3]